jgi:ATP-binding cassette subfamily B protein
MKGIFGKMKTNILEKGRKYNLIDFIKIPFQISPGFTLIKIINQIISASIPSIQVLVTASFIDTALAIFNGSREYNSIFFPLTGMMLIILYNYLNWSFVSYINLKLEMKMTEIFRTGIVEKRSRLEYRHIEDNDSWDLITRTCTDPVGKINGGFENVLGAINIVVRVFSLLAILITQVWWAALVIIGISVPLFLLAVKGGKATYQANKEAEKHTRRATYLHNVLTGRDNIEERALFGYTENLNGKWFDKYEEARKINLKVTLKYFIRIKGSSLITIVISIFIIGVLLFPLSDGAITPGMFMGLVTATLGLIQMMSWNLSWITSELAKSREYLKDLTAFMELSEQEGALDLPEETEKMSFESIEFCNVSFRYPGTDRDILKNFNLKIEKDLHYAIVGINGAGKTTITKLLTGMYDNFEGEIKINNKSIREYKQAELKAIFSVVYQDFAKYYISLKDNILLGDVNHTDEDKLSDVVSLLELEETIAKLPQGMDTYLGKIKEGGMDLSGGEWQRVAIARALYHPAKIRILDEPTAALDPVAESNIYEMFGKISQGKSTIFITHRLGAAKLADKIIVIHDGAVAEQGSHEKLMTLGGIYAEMFESQRSWYQCEV